jgi:MarR family transcriptional regulator, negative regulator of the multidrug operon emrRAB
MIQMKKDKKSERNELLSRSNYSLSKYRTLTQTIWLTGQAFDSNMKAFDKVMRDSGNNLTRSQWITLWILASSPGSMSLTDISRFLTITIQSTGSLVDILEKRGLIIRKRSQNNRRNVSISITENGLNLLKELLSPVTLFVINTTGILNERELELLGKLMRKIRDSSYKILNYDPEEADKVLKRLTDLTSYKTD